jgi:hypothetical protein
MVDLETTPPASRAVPAAGETGHYDAYASVARNLRTWFVAYGIGGPALIVSQEKVYTKLAASGSAGLIAACFLTGVVLQIGITIVNKFAMWFLYRGEYEPSLQGRRRYKLASWLGSVFWLEIVVDLATTCLFALATYSLVRVIAG